MRFVIALAALALALAFPVAGGAHIRYSGCDVYPVDYPNGYCEYFRGTTNDPGDHHRIDPINVVWYPYGTLPNVGRIMKYQFCWPFTDTSDQVNYRVVGSSDPDTWRWAWAEQEISRASDSWPGSRWHARVFRGHNHVSDYYDWSVSDAHHESWFWHDIDRDWDDVEARVRYLARVDGHSVDDFWTYLPRANDIIQGWYSDGWASRVGAGGPDDIDCNYRW